MRFLHCIFISYISPFIAFLKSFHFSFLITFLNSHFLLHFSIHHFSLLHFFISSLHLPLNFIPILILLFPFPPRLISYLPSPGYAAHLQNSCQLFFLFLLSRPAPSQSYFAPPCCYFSTNCTSGESWNFRIRNLEVSHIESSKPFFIIGIAFASLLVHSLTPCVI